MINQRSIECVDAAALGSRFRRPAYGSYCFAHVPGTVRSILGDRSVIASERLPDDVLPSSGGPYQKVIYLFVDAFGWWFFEQCRDRFPFLQRALRDGVVSKMTSMFPSTTAAHVTTIHTGLPVGQSGVVEWYYYEPTVGRVISPLLFSFAGDRQRETLLAAGVDPKELFPHRTQYQALRSCGVPSWIFQNAKYTPSPYSNVVFSGATVVPYKDERSGLRTLAEAVRATSGPGYFFIYLDSIDSTCHQNGPSSEKTIAAAEELFGHVERELMDVVGLGRPDTLLLALADHGHAPVSPDKAFYLNKEFKDFERFLRSDRNGNPIRFGGSARDLTLYLKPEVVGDVAGMLRERLTGTAEVFLTGELEQLGIFGPAGVSADCRARMGDLWILPYEQESVYWYERGMFDVDEFGHHGGLTPMEMDTALMAIPL